MIVSIDIGTSYSSICMLGPDGKAHSVDIGTGTSMFGSKYSLPSAVFVEDNGNVLVGQAAMNSRKRKPQNFRMEFKRNLGENIPILLGNHSFRPEELYTELFRHMKTRAEEVGGELVEKTFLTYPASYRKQRRDKLCAAANAAGLFELELVDEPTAAAMCYCAEGYIKDGQTLLVYDFGGGTFDVSLIRYENGKFELLAEPVGLERCGGMDIDYLIASDMRETIERELPGAWGKLQKNEQRFLRMTSQLNELAVKAKHHLSAASVFEEFLSVDLDDVSYQLTAERFNGMIAPLVGQTIQTCRRALDEAKISPSDVSAVLLVGGTSRIPLVKEMAKKITGKPALCAADLELAVAQGALVYKAPEKSSETLEKYFQKGQEAEKEKLYKDALKWYGKAAEQGHGKSETCIGYLYEKGRGVKKDYKQAFQWYQKAAEHGRAKAARKLGDFYAKGLGTAQDYTKTAEWYQKAANQGSATAALNLGDCYANGNGVEKDDKQAISWYLKATDQNGYASARSKAFYKLGQCYRKGKGVKQDYVQAVQWYRKAIEEGNADAMHALGVCYETGQGVIQDYKLAVQWYRKAADLGISEAMNSLGCCYRSGQGIVRDYDQAIQWFRKAIEAGNTNAMINLGSCYRLGQGIVRDYDQAFQWYRRAVEGGNHMAMNNLGYCYKLGIGVAQDYTQAIQWYRKAIEAGNTNAMNNLGVCYEFGEGVPKSRTKAIEWYRKAAEKGNENGKANLKRLTTGLRSFLGI